MKNLENLWNLKTAISRPGKVLQKKIFHEINACYRSVRTSFIGQRSVAGADVQPGGQVENRLVGDARC